MNILHKQANHNRIMGNARRLALGFMIYMSGCTNSATEEYVFSDSQPSKAAVNEHTKSSTTTSTNITTPIGTYDVPADCVTQVYEDFTETVNIARDYELNNGENTNTVLSPDRQIQELALIEAAETEKELKDYIIALYAEAGLDISIVNDAKFKTVYSEEFDIYSYGELNIMDLRRFAIKSVEFLAKYPQALHNELLESGSFTTIYLSKHITPNAPPFDAGTRHIGGAVDIFGNMYISAHADRQIISHELQHIIDAHYLVQSGLTIGSANQPLSCLQPPSTPYTYTRGRQQHYSPGDRHAELHAYQYGEFNAWEDSATIGENLAANAVPESILFDGETTVLDLKAARLIVCLAELDPSLASFYIDLV